MPRTVVGANLGKAISFPGGSSTRKVTVSGPAVIGGATSLSVSYWMNPQGAMNGSGSRSFEIVGGTNTFRVQHTTAGTNVVFVIDDGSARTVTSNAGPANDNWMHVIAIYDESIEDMTLYLDNILVGTNTQVTGALDMASSSLYIGNAAAATREFNGYIDDFRVYNKALTSAERAVLFAKGHVQDGLVIYFPFNSLEGLRAHDYSASGNFGTLGENLSLVEGIVPEMRYLAV